MRVLGLVVLGSLVLSTAVTADYAGDARRAPVLSERKSCLPCHSPNGRRGNFAPDLVRRMGRNYTSAKMAPLGWNHAPGTGAAMRRVGISKLGLSEEHASDLLGYLFADWYCDRTGDSVPGRRLFAERRCEMWHAVAGANSAASRAIQWQSLDDQCLFLSRCGTILRPGKRVQPADEHGWTRITPFV